ncbi:lysine--tRNA ligase [candidate division WWE3 bacterium]|uniref:Lysine--tRNA ligase n=1 Tax=candidate division WWE3 bacterium TaxID=2053526 RepID=A0A955LJ72_UNCKA|nr:lysine--tRNA ligase [candidate division WWE3 bacterium]
MAKEDSTQPIEEIRQEKIRKIEAIRALGVNPFPPKAEFELQPINEVRELKEDDKVAVAGRLTSIRTHGGITFADVKDRTGSIQLAFKKDNLSEDQLKLFALIDPSDHIEVNGRLFITNAGELTVNVDDFNLLGKSIRPVPDEPMNDKEIRFRKRYLDLLTNPDAVRVFDIRHRLTSGIRRFLDDKKLVEVETSVLQPLYGGANAKPFTTHINALDAEAYLRIAPELYLKRLVVAGFEGVYELAKDFRNEGVDQTHFPEFTMLEVYISYIDYQKMMDTMEEMFRFLSKEVLGMDKVQVLENEIDLGGQWQRITMTDLIKQELEINVEEKSREELLSFAESQRLEVNESMTKGTLTFLIFDKLISHTLLAPTWVIDYPIEVSPLSKMHRSKEGYTERFELYIGGVELLDGWSEVTDPIDQRSRFEAESYRDFDETEAAQPVDEDFLEAIEYGLPPFSGIGTGIDRLTMFFANTWSIQETILFPFKKPQTNTKQAMTFDDDLSNLPSRAEAEQLLEEHVLDNYQSLHAKMVASVLEKYAMQFDQNDDLWYITGLLHDLDFNKHPEEHPQKALEWFKEWNYPQELIHAIGAHAHERTGVEPQTLLAQALTATDELAGIMYAYALLRPEGFEGMKVSSLKKKIKDKAFAPNIDRESVSYGLEHFAVEPEEHMQLMIEAFQGLPELKDVHAGD